MSPPLFPLYLIRRNEFSLKIRSMVSLEFGPNFDGMVLKWSPFRIISDDPDVHPTWPLSADIVLT